MDSITKEQLELYLKNLEKQYSEYKQKVEMGKSRMLEIQGAIRFVKQLLGG